MITCDISYSTMTIMRVKEKICTNLSTQPGKKIQPGKPSSSEIYLHFVYSVVQCRIDTVVLHTQVSSLDRVCY